VFGHRHGAEIEQGVGVRSRSHPHLVPLDRGILATIYVRVAPGTTEEAIADVLEHATWDTFVRLVGSSLPEIKHVAHTNFATLAGGSIPSGRVILGFRRRQPAEGRVSQAVQNMNVMLGSTNGPGCCDRRSGQAVMSTRPGEVRWRAARGSHAPGDGRRRTRAGRGAAVPSCCPRRVRRSTVHSKWQGWMKRQVGRLRITDDATPGSGGVGPCRRRQYAVRGHAGDGWCLGFWSSPARTQAAGCSDPAPPHHAVDGRVVDLGRVGHPSCTPTHGCCDARRHGFVPVVASIASPRWRLSTSTPTRWRGAPAARLGARRLASLVRRPESWARRHHRHQCSTPPQSASRRPSTATAA